MSDANSFKAAQVWLASEAWQDSERNYLADHDLTDDLQEAVDNALMEAFMAGARWAAEQKGTR